MPDREKLTDAMNDVKAVENFLRKQGESWYADILSDAFDTLALLRKQEAVKPNTSCDGLPGDGGTWWYVCGNCNKDIDPDDAYCRHCGKKVDWDA